ncbi:hypothetical protein VKT23_006627 [Stygiomarasmius scandens]|uniref:Uncharacterized protein n=1 Tax=Marasmiellus scandens TaxID=2682957 RepID=A0ABR1JT14_9AGAR
MKLSSSSSLMLATLAISSSSSSLAAPTGDASQAQTRAVGVSNNHFIASRRGSVSIPRAEVDHLDNTDNGREDEQEWEGTPMARRDDELLDCVVKTVKSVPAVGDVVGPLLGPVLGLLEPALNPVLQPLVPVLSPVLGAVHLCTTSNTVAQAIESVQSHSVGATHSTEPQDNPYSLEGYNLLNDSGDQPASPDDTHTVSEESDNSESDYASSTPSPSAPPNTPAVPSSTIASDPSSSATMPSSSYALLRNVAAESQVPGVLQSHLPIPNGVPTQVTTNIPLSNVPTGSVPVGAPAQTPFVPALPGGVAGHVSPIDPSVPVNVGATSALPAQVKDVTSTMTTTTFTTVTSTETESSTASSTA